MIPIDDHFKSFPSSLSTRLLETVKKFWHLVPRPIQLGLGAGSIVTLLTLGLPNQFKSETRLLPADARSSGGGGAASAAAAAMGVSIPGQESPDAVLVDILKSRSLREALLKTTFTFKIQTWYFGPFNIREQTLYDYLGKKNMDRAIKDLNDNIVINRDLKTKLITIVVETRSAELSQQMAQTLVRLLDEFVVAKSRTRGGAKVAFSEKRLVEARAEMAQAEDAFRAFLDGNRNYLLSPDPAVRLKGMRLDNELKLRTQLVTTLAIGREQALLEEKNDMPILNILDAGNLPIDKSKPARSGIVLISILITALGDWVWANRTRVKSFIFSRD